VLAAEQPDLMTLPEWISTNEAKRRYGVSRPTLVAWCDIRDDLAIRKVSKGSAGFRFLVNTLILEELIAARKRKRPPARLPIAAVGEAAHGTE
jgi:hypothetical protein